MIQFVGVPSCSSADAQQCLGTTLVLTSCKTCKSCKPTVYEDYGDLFCTAALCNLQETAGAGTAECFYLNNVYEKLSEHFNARRLFNENQQPYFSGHNGEIFSWWKARLFISYFYYFTYNCLHFYQVIITDFVDFQSISAEYSHRREIFDSE